MADKKYYWLKLKKDFFKRHDIRIIEAMPNGKDYVLFYLKMLVESIDHEGLLRFNDTIPYNLTMLSTITNTNPDVVKSAMDIFTQLNMIEVLEDETIFMNEVEKMMGTETYWAEQKRKQRVGQSPQNVQLLSNVSKQEIDIELEKEIDIKIYNPVIEFLNNKAGSKFRATTNKTKSLIDARVNEGFTLEDFQTVIDIKVTEWKGTDYEKFLRPETLFGTKFEGYLNQNKTTANKKRADIAEIEHIERI